MPKKNIIILITILLVTLILSGGFLLLQLNQKPTEDITIKNDSSQTSATSNSIEETRTESSMNSESKNKPNFDIESSNTQYSSSSSSISSKNSSVTTSSSLANESVNTFTENKLLLDGSKLYSIKDFDKNKLTQPALLEFPNLYPNTEKPENLFVDIDGKKRFLGDGIVDIFQFKVRDTKYNLVEFLDETGYPSIYITNEDYSEQRKVYTSFNYSSGKFSQKGDSSKFIFNGSADNGNVQNAIEMNFDIQDIIDFDPQE